jgi:hypothetical protein
MQPMLAATLALNNIAEALARGSTRIGPDGLARAGAAFVRLGHAPTPMLGETPLKAVLRGDSADAGASALLEMLLGLAAGDGGGNGDLVQLPQEHAECIARVLLDVLPRLSPQMVAAVLAAFPRLGLAAATARLLAKFLAEYVRRPVPQPGPALVLAVLRGLAASSGSKGGPGDAALRGVPAALLSRLWEDLKPDLPALPARDFAAAAGLLAQLGCLSPATPWKAAIAEALTAELRARLAPAAPQPAMIAALPTFAVTLHEADQQLGTRELAAQLGRTLEAMLSHAPPAALWLCVLELAGLEPQLQIALFGPSTGATGSGVAGSGPEAAAGLSALGARILETVAPHMAAIAAAAAAASPSQPKIDGASGSAAEAATVTGAAPPTLEVLAAVAEAWARQPTARVRANGAGLLAWLDAPPVLAAAFAPLMPVVEVDGDAAVEGDAGQGPHLVRVPVALDASAWHTLARLASAVVDIVSAAEEEAQQQRHRQGAGTGADGGDAAAYKGDQTVAELAPPAALLAECLALLDGQGPPPGTCGAAACSAADAVALLWSTSVLGALGLSHWDVLAVALDTAQGAPFSEAQLARVFEAHALVLLRIHGVAALQTPPGELMRCRAAYWEAYLAPVAGLRATLAGALGRAGLLPPGGGVTVQEQGHLLVLDCVAPGG